MQIAIHPDARIFIADDQEANIILLEAILRRAGYTNFQSTPDPRLLFEWFKEGEPDLLLLDLMMPGMSGLEVMERLREVIPAETFLPILVLTANATPDARTSALGAYATDFLLKPFDRAEVLLRIRNLLHIRYLHRDLAKYSQELEAAVADRTRSLSKALSELEATQKHLVQQERLKAFGLMASGVAHDFNNVLGITLGYGEVLLAGSALGSQERQRCARAIISAAQDGAQMVSRLQNFYRPESETIVEESVDLNALVRQALDLTEPKWKGQAQRRGIFIEASAQTEPAPPVAGNAPELREMLTNLIFNATDAMTSNGSITVRTRAEAGWVVLEVADTGCGMTEEVRERCLEPFFTTKGKEGTGLGLAMVYGIAQRHHAAMEIDSELGLGTTFRFLFPALSEEAEKHVHADVDLARSLQVLVVDDQEFICEIIVSFLEADCHVAEAVTNGRDALKRIAVKNFDLLITDQAMPDMNGGQLAIEAKRRNPYTRVILLTGFGEGERPEVGAEAIDLVAGKPITRMALRKAVAEVLIARGEERT